MRNYFLVVILCNLIWILAFILLLYTEAKYEMELIRRCESSNWTGLFVSNNEVIICYPNKEVVITNDFKHYNIYSLRGEVIQDGI